MPLNKVTYFKTSDIDSLLIIFVKNPIMSKVKTRLAKSIGDEKALRIYQDLLIYTHKITLGLHSDKAIYYSDFLEENDLWSNNNYQKFIQKGNDLGERMLDAFKNSFEKGYKKVVIIGSDCLELKSEIINKAFETLKDNSFAIGPSEDGGYYLLGMKKLWPGIFQEKSWSTNQLIKETMFEIGKLNQSFTLLPTLSDIDNISDLKKSHLFEKYYDEND